MSDRGKGGDVVDGGKDGDGENATDDRQQVEQRHLLIVDGDLVQRAGNVTTLTDGQNSSQVQSFGYDWLDRLVSASTNAAGAGQYNHTYAYNATGNLTSYAGSSYTYGDSAHKHAVTAAFGNSYTYDGNGNQVTRTIGGTLYTFVYDYENRLTEVKQGSSVLASFVYDAEGNRVKGTVGGVNTVYIAGLYEYQGAATTKYYAGHNGIVAMRRSGYASSNGVFYMLSDQLQSVSRILNRNNTVATTQYYYPYGGKRPSGAFSTLTTKRFTGQYHEASLPGGEGLSYYNARWYDARLGRFTSADTLVPDPGNPQAFNRYSYVYNNPLGFVDPSGHIPMIPVGEGGTACIPDNCSGLGGEHNTYVRIGVHLPSLFGTQYHTYTFDTHRDLTWRNVYTAWRGLWDASIFGRFNTDVNGGVAAWQAWGEQNTERLPESAQAVVQMIDDPLFQIALMGTVQGIPAGMGSLKLGADDFYSATQVADRAGFTRAGRALQKHANRPGSVWAKYLPSGTLHPSNYNSQADELMLDILTDPNTSFRTRSSRYFGTVHEFFAADGRGLRFDSSGNFVGFLEP